MQRNICQEPNASVREEEPKDALDPPDSGSLCLQRSRRRPKLGGIHLSGVRYLGGLSGQSEDRNHDLPNRRWPSVPARVYSVRQDKGEFKLTVADLANAGPDEKAIIDHAIKAVSQGATAKVNVPARIYRVYGRQLTVEGPDGSRSMVAVFDLKGRLFQIEAKVPRGGSEFELTRFQQSLVFDREISNRSPEEIRAIREGCPGLVGVLNGAGNPVNPAGTDDPRC
jgi:hypothetical protein